MENRNLEEESEEEDFLIDDGIIISRSSDSLNDFEDPNFEINAEEIFHEGFYDDEIVYHPFIYKDRIVASTFTDKELDCLNMDQHILASKYYINKRIVDLELEPKWKILEILQNEFPQMGKKQIKKKIVNYFTYLIEVGCDFLKLDGYFRKAPFLLQEKNEWKDAIRHGLPKINWFDTPNRYEVLMDTLAHKKLTLKDLLELEKEFFDVNSFYFPIKEIYELFQSLKPHRLRKEWIDFHKKELEEGFDKREWLRIQKLSPYERLMEREPFLASLAKYIQSDELTSFGGMRVTRIMRKSTQDNRSKEKLLELKLRRMPTKKFRKKMKKERKSKKRNKKQVVIQQKK